MFRHKTHLGSSLSLRRHRGFSVVEMTVVLLIIAIIAAFVVPQILNYMKRYRLGVAARNVATAMQRARYLATSDNKRSGVVITQAQRLEIEQYDAESMKPTNRGTIYLPEGTTISADAPRQIAFDGRGVVNPFPKESPVFRINGADGYYTVVTVSPTGQVTVGDARQDEV